MLDPPACVPASTLLDHVPYTPAFAEPLSAGIWSHRSLPNEPATPTPLPSDSAGFAPTTRIPDGRCPRPGGPRYTPTAQPTVSPLHGCVRVRIPAPGRGIPRFA